MTPENERDANADDESASANDVPNGAEGANEAADTIGNPNAGNGAGEEAVAKVDPAVIDLASVVAGLDADSSENPSAETVDDAAADGEAGAPAPTLEEKLATADALAAAHWDRLMRLQADMENQRKRAQRDVSNARKFALEGIAGDLLPVKDSLELGIRAATAEEASLANLLEGSELTLKMLAQVLEKNAIAEVNPDGEKFDPEFHQAMSMQEVEGVAPNTVTGVMQKGYTLNDRLIRPALVMVSK